MNFAGYQLTSLEGDSMDPTPSSTEKVAFWFSLSLVIRELLENISPFSYIIKGKQMRTRLQGLVCLVFMEYLEFIRESCMKTFINL